MRSIFLLIVLVLFTFSCTEELSPVDYDNWVKSAENGLHKEKRVGDYVFDIQYKTPEFMVLNLLKGKVERKAQLDSLTNKYKDLHYFNLQIGLKNQSEDLLKYRLQSEQEYNDRLYYFAYNFEKDLKLKVGEQELPCALFVFERSFDLKPSRSFVLAFEKDSTVNEDITLVIDSPYFNTGKVQVTINTQQEIPSIRI